MSDAVNGTPARCPWCSAVLPAELPAGDAPACPTCGATLTSASTPEPDIRGVTTLDHEAILRARSDVSRPRGRLLSFITGDASSGGKLDPADVASLAPPADEVRREMLRLEIEAQRADIEAETVALRTEAAMELGLDVASLDEPAGADMPDEATSGTAPGESPDGPAAVDAIPAAPPPPPVIAAEPGTADSAPAPLAPPPPPGGATMPPPPGTPSDKSTSPGS